MKLPVAVFRFYRRPRGKEQVPRIALLIDSVQAQEFYTGEEAKNILVYLQEVCKIPRIKILDLGEVCLGASEFNYIERQLNIRIKGTWNK